MNCLLCEAEFIEKPTWQTLFLLKPNEVICEKCRAAFEKTEDRDFKDDWRGTKFDGALDSLTSIYTYNDFMKDVLHQYKFLQDVELSMVFMEDFALLKKGTDMVVPIPMHPEKLRERTFSQVDELLNAANIPFTQVLEKTLNTTQGKKSKLDRINSEILFQVNKEVTGKSIILVDDLYTTGTTIYHAAYVLKNAGAAKVSAVTLVRA
ncbi:MAG: ComF family protein [Paenisporosarcina sp.]